jgi:single-strand DNA-binding protein
MAGSVNKATLLGNLGRDPDVRTLNDGSKVVNLSLATSESWTDKASGEKRERTEWHRVVIFNDRIGDIAERYLRKGSKVYIEGQIQTRKYVDAAGVEKYSTEIVLQRFRGELTLLGDGGTRDPGATSRPPGSSSTAAKPAPFDDEIPF